MQRENPYKLLHNSEWVLHTVATVFGKNGFLLFTAYSAPVERRFQGFGISTEVPASHECS